MNHDEEKFNFLAFVSELEKEKDWQVLMIKILSEIRRIERLRLEGTDRTVPHQRAAFAQLGADRGHALRTDIENHRVVRHAFGRNNLAGGAGFQFRGHHDIDGQHQMRSFRLGFGEDGARGIEHVVLE